MNIEIIVDSAKIVKNQDKLWVHGLFDGETVTQLGSWRNIEDIPKSVGLYDKDSNEVYVEPYKPEPNHSAIFKDVIDALLSLSTHQ